jgi:hypothetical protein
MSKHSRPGVEAAVRLAKQTGEKELWECIEGQYSAMIHDKGGSKLTNLDTFCQSLGDKIREGSYTLSKADFLQVIDWKFTKGKPRHALKKFLNQNSEEDVKQVWNEAARLAQDNNVKGAIDAFSTLKGVGPATASAFLSLYRPETFAFMDDEVIECLHEGKRGYTTKIYLNMNEKCAAIGNALDWTPRKVGRALWTAARIHASGGDDLTLKAKVDMSTTGISSGKQKRSKTSNPSPLQSRKKRKLLNK